MDIGRAKSHLLLDRDEHFLIEPTQSHKKDKSLRAIVNLEHPNVKYTGIKINKIKMFIIRVELELFDCGLKTKFGKTRINVKLQVNIILF
jgi:hypothetical protein